MSTQTWVDDKTTEQKYQVIKWRKLNLKRRADRALSNALLELMRESYCRRKGCRVISVGAKPRNWRASVQIRHHHWCLAGRDALKNSPKDSVLDRISGAVTANYDF